MDAIIRMKNIPFYIILILLVVIILLPFKRCNNDVAQIFTPNELAKIVIKNEDGYKKKYDSILASEKTLVIREKYFKLSLAEERLRYKKLFNSIDTSVAKYIPQNDYDVNSEAVLMQELDNLRNSGENKDSLCDGAIAVLESRIEKKDSMIFLKDNLYSQLRESFKISNNQLRAKKRATTFWKIAAIVAGAFIINEKFIK